eukprot:m.692582 g.692582  ORF g.692582 m.692582 type:complete len:62 (+) comp58650_c0_seq41:66-251(+)
MLRNAITLEFTMRLSVDEEGPAGSGRLHAFAASMDSSLLITAKKQASVCMESTERVTAAQH